MALDGGRDNVRNDRRTTFAANLVTESRHPKRQIEAPATVSPQDLSPKHESINMVQYKLQKGFFLS